MTKEITAIKLRHNLGEILDQVANTRARFLIKRSGIPAAVILSVSDYEDLEDLIDTYYEQQDEIFQQSLNHAREEITPSAPFVSACITSQPRARGDHQRQSSDA